MAKTLRIPPCASWIVIAAPGDCIKAASRRLAPKQHHSGSGLRSLRAAALHPDRLSV
jgi:hypothetical protein